MKIKSIVSAIVALALTAALAVPAFAASGINAEEQRVLDSMDRTIAGVRVVETPIGALNYNNVRNFLLRDDIDLNAAQADGLIGYVNQGFDLAVANNITTEAELMVYMDEFSNLAAQAAMSLGFKLTVNPDGTFSVQDVNGDTVVTGGDGAIKQTGADFTATWAVLALVVAATAGCAVFVKKNRATA